MVRTDNDKRGRLVDDGYGSTHRHHMAHEIEHQNKEWRQLNVVDPKPNLIRYGLWIIVGILASSLVILALDKAIGVMFR